MTYTNFPNGVTSFGVPMIGGIGGIPLTGNWWFVNYATGNDGNASAGDPGCGPQAPMKTLAQAYSYAADGNNDVIVIMGDGTTAATQRLSSSLTWAKNALHMIGITAPTMIAQRARISTLTTQTTNINPLMTVSGSGCMFLNFSFFQGVGQSATDEQLIDITGDRNYFGNVHFGGMGHANGAARAGSYVIYLNDADENTFDTCTIGLDTIARSAANASVKFRNAAQRNIFKDCLFPMYATATTPLFIDAAASGSIDRMEWFRKCCFLNTLNVGSVQSVAAVVGFHASQGGTIFMDECSAVGATDWTASDTATVKITGAVPNGDTSGMAVSADAT